MDCFPSANSISVKVKREVDDQYVADELDNVPLKERMKMLLFAFGHNLSTMVPTSLHKAVVKEGALVLEDTPFGDYAHARSSSVCGNGGRKEGFHSVDEQIPQEQSAAKVPTSTFTERYCVVKPCQLKVHAMDSSRGSSLQETTPNGYAIGLKEVDANAHDVPHSSILSSWPMKVKVENYNDYQISACKDDMVSLCNADKQIVEVKSEVHNDFEIDQLDHISLQERRRALLLNCHSCFIDDLKCSQTHVTRAREFDSYNSLNAKASSITLGRVTQRTSMCSFEVAHGEDFCALRQEVSLGESSDHMKDVDPPCIGKIKDEIHPADSIYETNAMDLFRTSTSSTNSFTSSASTGSSSAVAYCSPKIGKCLDNTLAKPSNLQETQGIESRCSYLTSTAEVKAPNENMVQSALPSFPMQVKAENLEDGLKGHSNDRLGNFLSADMLAVKVKREILGEFFADDVDHIPLQVRFKMLVSRSASGLDHSQDLNRSRQTVPCIQEYVPIDSVNVERNGAAIRQKRQKIMMDSAQMEHVPGAYESVPIDSVKTSRCTLRRKRKKTVTDSVETALEEDAPGLLQVLVDKGINADEIKLYGGVEDEDALDISAGEDGFSELQSVISKLFSQPSTLLKFTSIRHTKQSKVKYCLACLVSLVEQTRYLQFRKCPVEWGWCRDLQSFIFVFERHNRIVLERPEYGYATYFFELVESLPISWQIKRLVTAMKLTSCGRATLIENKALLVGEDLTEGEARVLEEYGWVPNSGLGTMLHYCDRVVHDKKSEDVKSESEWRSKIGRLLMNGYDGGSIVLPNLPKRVTEYKGSQSQRIKVEV